VSLIATIALFTTTVAVARVQFDGFAPASQISCDGYVPLGVLALLLSFHQYLYINGPFVTGVTSVLAAVACIPLTFLLHYLLGKNYYWQ
jgi:protein-S-isoprenylcysteine O-methyltransferase Ste14